MSTVRWEDVQRKADDYREANGLPVRGPEEKRAAMDRLFERVRACRDRRRSDTTEDRT